MLVAIVFVTALTCVAQSTAKISSADKLAEAEVRRLTGEEITAFLHNDPEALSKLWSKDFVVTNPQNKFLTGAQVLDNMRTGRLVIVAHLRDIDYVRVYGDTVIMAGRETITWGKPMPNAGKTEHLRFTAVWMKQNGRWLKVARHANVVPEP
jgi:hypothetical protein